jgi:hypothetical protein
MPTGDLASIAEVAFDSRQFDPVITLPENSRGVLHPKTDKTFPHSHQPRPLGVRRLLAVVGIAAIRDHHAPIQEVQSFVRLHQIK